MGVRWGFVQPLERRFVQLGVNVAILRQPALPGDEPLLRRRWPEIALPVWAGSQECRKAQILRCEPVRVELVPDDRHAAASGGFVSGKFGESPLDGAA